MFHRGFCCVDRVESHKVNMTFAVPVNTITLQCRLGKGMLYLVVVPTFFMWAPGGPESAVAWKLMPCADTKPSDPSTLLARLMSVSCDSHSSGKQG